MFHTANRYQAVSASHMCVGSHCYLLMSRTSSARSLSDNDHRSLCSATWSFIRITLQLCVPQGSVLGPLLFAFIYLCDHLAGWLLCTFIWGLVAPPLHVFSWHRAKHLFFFFRNSFSNSFVFNYLTVSEFLHSHRTPSRLSGQLTSCSWGLPKLGWSSEGTERFLLQQQNCEINCRCTLDKPALWLILKLFLKHDSFLFFWLPTPCRLLLFICTDVFCGVDSIYLLLYCGIFCSIFILILCFYCVYFTIQAFCKPLCWFKFVLKLVWIRVLCGCILTPLRS